jgi:hypothetical protein
MQGVDERMMKAMQDETMDARWFLLWVGLWIAALAALLPALI